MASSSSSSLIGGKTIEQWLTEIKGRKREPANANAQAKRPQSFRDAVVQARVHRDRDQLIAAIRDDDVCRLASLNHHGDACVLFRPFVRGSYNICYFVEFQNGDRWVVRIPLAPTLALPPADKLESEVTVMQ